MKKGVCKFSLLVFFALLIHNLCIAQITRTQIVNNASAYLSLTWTATSSNIQSACAYIQGGYYKTPTWVTTGTQTSAPYKWNGFTPSSSFSSLISQGKKAGNYATSKNSTCSQPAHTDYSDAYIIGVDCSGLVSRVWEQTTKYSTVTLSNISSQINYSQLQPGDIVNKKDDHTRLIKVYNANGSATVVEATGGVWKVREYPYNPINQSGYVALCPSSNIVTGGCGGTPCTPPNDNCASATTITSNGSTLNGTVDCATGSYGANQCSGCNCTSPDDKDVYYKFTAQATSHTVTVSNYSSNFDAVIELRTACASGSSNVIGCYDPSGSPTSVSNTWTNLTINQTYYIRVFEFNNTNTPPSSPTFTISVTHTSTNKPDLTITANTQSISPTTVCAGSTLSASCSEDNSGNATAGSNPVTLWLSADGVLQKSNDTYLGSITGFPSLNAGSNSAIRTNSSVTIPASTLGGTYYLFFWADGVNDNNAGDVVSESDETNNYASRQITVNPLPTQPGTISGNTAVCSGTSQTYSISSVSGANSYTWSYSGGGAPSGTGTSVIFSPTSSGTLSVKANNNCGSGSARTLNISIQQQPVSDLTVNQQTGIAPLNVTFNDASTNTPTQWEWTFSGGSPSTSNIQNPTVVYANSGSFNVTLKTTNNCGSNTTNKPNYINVTEPVGFQNIEESDKLHIFPNPNNGTFRITADIKISNSIQLNLFSLLGQNIYSEQISPVSNQLNKVISVKDVAKGVYIVQLVIDQKYLYKRIVIE